MRPRSLLLLLPLLALPLRASATPTVPSAFADDARDCAQLPPQQVLTPSLDVTPVYRVNAVFSVAKADLALAQRFATTTVAAYQRIGVDLRVRWDVTAKEILPTDDLASLEGNLRKHFGGHKPKGVDVVYQFSRYWEGGHGDCVTGALYPDTGFALGSLEYKTEGVVGQPTVNEGVIAAHEIGHLLGAHHHYSNCVQAQPAAGLRGNLPPCTVMSPASAMASDEFSTVERTYIRYYAALVSKRH